MQREEEMKTNSNNPRMNDAEFVKRLNETVDRYAMLTHPFYQMWNEGKLTKEILAEYARQYYAHVKAFPTYVSAVHSNCDDLPTRQILLDNLIEEEKGDENHPELWLRFAESVGADRDSVKNAELLGSTEATVETLKRLTSELDYRSGVAALYAYESQIPEVSRTKRAGLKKFFGIDDERSVSFFSVHEAADIYHRNAELEILTKSCTTKESQENAIASAEKASRALLKFLDGIYEALIPLEMRMCEVTEIASA